MDGGLLAMRPDGEVNTAWRRAGTVFVTHQDASDEESVGTGEQPWVATNSNGTYIVWTSKREGELLLAKIESHVPEKISDNARDFVIVAVDGSKPFVQVFWEVRSWQLKSHYGAYERIESLSRRTLPLRIAALLFPVHRIAR